MTMVPKLHKKSSHLVRWSKIVGGETAMWTEQAGDQNALTKIFPRSYALAERYWSDPTTGINLQSNYLVTIVTAQ